MITLKRGLSLLLAFNISLGISCILSCTAPLQIHVSESNPSETLEASLGNETPVDNNEKTTEESESPETSASSGSKHHVVRYDYGNFSGWDVIFEEGPMPEVWTIRVSHYLFRCTSSFNIRAEKDGEVYWLEDAYNNGLLTEADLAEIYRLHRELITYCGFDSLYKDVDDYGVYSGWFVQIYDAGLVRIDEPVDIICGYSFRLPSGSYIITAQKDGEEYLLAKAFEKGFLTEDAIAAIYLIHRDYCESHGYASLYED